MSIHDHGRALLVALGTTVILLPALASAALSHLGEEIVLELDPASHFPKGELVEANGLLVDPRDLPERVAPYMDPLLGLEGVEASLTGLFGRSLGFAVERKKLAKRYSEFCKHQRDQWNGLTEELRSRLEDDEGLVAAALYHDTGRRVTSKQMRVVGPPRMTMVPISSGDLETLLQLQHDVALFGREMPKESAVRLREIVTPMMGEVDDPWFGHATFRLGLLSFGEALDEDMLANPFDMTPDQFLDRCRRALREALVDPLFPKLTDTVEAGGTWFLEGLVVAELVAEEGNPSHPNLEQQTAVVKQPILCVQMQPKKPKKKGSALKAATISMIAGGGTHELYQGKWPLK